MSISEFIAICISLVAISVSIFTGIATWRAPSEAERLADQLRKVSSESEFRARLKFDCLRRIAGHRGTYMTSPDFFTALNEAFVVFNDSPKVLDKLKLFQRLSSKGQSYNSYLLDLIKEMIDALHLDRSLLDDEFLLSPFGSG